MAKKIALLFFILLAPSWVFAKTVNRDGLLVVRVNKKDVSKYYSEEIKRSLGKSFSSSIDFQERIVFVSEDLSKYFFSDGEFRDKIFGTPVSDTLDCCIPASLTFLPHCMSAKQIDRHYRAGTLLKQIINFSPYYDLEDRDYLYKIVKLQIKSNAVNMDSVDVEWRQMMLSDGGYSTDKKGVVFCYLQELVYYDPYYALSLGIRFWLPR